MKKKAKKVQGEHVPVKSNPARGKATRAVDAKPAKAEATQGSASKAVSGETAPAAGLTKPKIKQIQAMLKSKTAEGISLGLSMLESLNAIGTDYEAVFTEKGAIKGYKYAPKKPEEKQKEIFPKGKLFESPNRSAIGL